MLPAGFDPGEPTAGSLFGHDTIRITDVKDRFLRNTQIYATIHSVRRADLSDVLTERTERT